ncbi:subclass B1 metallo-beta-lactamase [Pedobacter sp. UYP30]|uniref:subclass B1 metallo-beta-lactamase n=1 Tax=Pedobacter sp. UYP30 TaxID=1756400 RepID=UPI0033996166
MAKKILRKSSLLVCSFAIVGLASQELRAMVLQKAPQKDTIYKSSQLMLVKLSNHTYQHISFLKTKDFGNVECNGMLVINDHEAVIFDTPATNSSTEELIQYVTKKLKAEIKVVIPTHFHQDCVAGLNAFHKHRIPIEASTKTIAFLKRAGNKYLPFIKSFNHLLTLNIGNKKVYAQFLGEGHTKDNVVGYFPADQVLFGGCLIKELGAQKGNLEDANVAAWLGTVKNVARSCPHANIVIPGHGKSGGTDLLDYTASLLE